MPDDSPPVRPAMLGTFEPRALRTSPDERQLLTIWLERVLARHPAWPWPLIEEEARRLAAGEAAAGHGSGDC
jgi:hypothetical protein